MKKLIIALAVFCILVSAASGFELSLTGEVPNYKDLELTLKPAADESIVQARFYFMYDSGKQLLFADFVQRDGVWKTTVPFKYLKGEELEYYVQTKSAKGVISRVPATGKSKARLIQDVTPPTLYLEKPTEFFLEKGKEQEVRFRITDDSIISDFEARYDGKLVTESLIYLDKLYMVISPPKDDAKEAKLNITVIDYFGNRTVKDFKFLLAREKGPFFSIRNDWAAKAKVNYDLKFGETANSTDIMTVLSDMTHEPTLEYELSGRTRPNAGPVSLDLGLTLADSVSLLEIGQAYPNSWIADYQNFATLLHPWNFAREFDWSGQEARHYYNDNKAWAKLSILDPLLSYTFGDQEISYQTKTVKDFGFRGHSASFRIPGLTIGAAKGLSDPGLYETTWPQNFAAVEAGIAIFDLFWLKTNVSMISALQGRYDDLIQTGATSQIGTLYGLSSIKPDENLVVGLTTGTKNKLFNLELGAGLTLYNDDAAEFLNITDLASQIKTAFDFDMTPYLGTVNDIKAIFPIFDYFPITKGIAAKALSRDLWGISYGADLKITPLGLEGWFHKTDAAYKSLAASVDTDQMKAGGSWKINLRDFDIGAGYEWKKDNIPDILFNDILPLVSSDFAITASPTVDDISNVTQVAEASIQTPSAGQLGSLKLSYKFEYATTNAEKLAQSASTANAAALRASTLKDTLTVHTGGLQWRSGRIRMDDSVLNFGAKTEDSYNTYSEVDGAASTLSFWEFGYGLDFGIQLGRYKWTHAFEHQWTTEAAPSMDFAYAQKLIISKGFLDKVTWGLKGDLGLLSSAPQQWDAGGSVAIEKAFGKLLVGMSAEALYLDSLVDNTDDKITAKLNVSGTLEL